MTEQVALLVLRDRPHIPAEMQPQQVFGRDAIPNQDGHLVGANAGIGGGPGGQVYYRNNK